MKRKEFEKALDYNDFAIGDEFWLEGIKFEVKAKRRKGFICLNCGEEKEPYWYNPISDEGFCEECYEAQPYPRVNYWNWQRVFK